MKEPTVIVSIAFEWIGILYYRECRNVISLDQE